MWYELVWVLSIAQSINRPATAGEVTATEALRDACQNLKEVCMHAKQTFKDANAEFDNNQPEAMQT